jgi:hypothetical protein
MSTFREKGRGQQALVHDIRAGDICAKSEMPSKCYNRSDQLFEWQVCDTRMEDPEEVIEYTGLLCKKSPV